MRTLEMDGRKVNVRPARWEELVDLRHGVLRQGLPRGEAIFPGDDAPTTRHFGAFHAGVAVGCATFLLNRWEAEPAWQLRGMATLPEYRGKGVGRALLDEAEAGLGDALLWCNARVPAVGFYQAMGWRVVSAQFEVPTAGPHVKMTRMLPDAAGE